MSVGTKLKSHTTKVASTGPFYVDGQPVILIDTPGFDNTQGVSFNDIMTEVKVYLNQKYVNSTSPPTVTDSANLKDFIKIR
jgi:GTPase Era involved in 16S rRNA processing